MASATEPIQKVHVLSLLVSGFLLALLPPGRFGRKGTYFLGLLQFVPSSGLPVLFCTTANSPTMMG